jgi:hypothetical protein
MLDEPEIERERKFAWDTTHDALREALLGCDDTRSLLRAERGSHHFLARGIDVRAPLLWPPAHEAETAEHWLQRLPAGPGSHVVLLVQAGAIAMGYWEDEELIVHNAFKRYVVRGKGRAQPTHLKTRGKSRYGSRLRLQNFKRQLVELNERLHQWWAEYGCPQQLFLSCPQRIWPELWNVDPQPPFDQRPVLPQLRKVPLDVRVPTHEELLRVHRFLGRGRVRWYISP